MFLKLPVGARSVCAIYAQYCVAFNPLRQIMGLFAMYTPFLITYDNRSPRNYSAVHRLMETWGAVRLAQSVWLMNSTAGAAQLREAVMSTLEPDDTVAVVPLQRGGSWATYSVGSTAERWLKMNVTATLAA